MYFFLGGESSPEMFNIGTQNRSISKMSSARQTCFSFMVGATECFFMALIFYNYYVAICKPLNYHVGMNPNKYTHVMSGSWSYGIPVQRGKTCQVFPLHFCNSNQFNHFFWVLPPILKLACGDSSVNELSVFLLVMLFIFFLFS